MHAALIFLHGLLRWVVLAAAVNALVRLVRGREYTASEARAGLFFVIALDTQVLVGLLLYVAVSPMTQAALANVSAAMKNSGLRFFLVEHPFSMLLALAAAHVGRVLVRRASDPRLQLRRARVWTAAALVALLVGVPWPGLPYGRALLPHF